MAENNYNENAVLGNAYLHDFCIIAWCEASVLEEFHITLTLLAIINLLQKELCCL
jgi:hypothetical protein